MRDFRDGWVFGSRAEALTGRIRVHVYLFDLLHLDGFNTSALPLLEPKRLLEQAVQFEDPIRMTVHRIKEGEAYFGRACKKDWEGIIVK